MRRATLLLLTLALRAHAAVPGLTLTWSAPPDCPSGEKVEAAVARVLGDPTAPSDPPLSITALVTYADAAWHIELKNAQGGTRSLTGQTCHAVSSAAVVVIALMIDPLAVTDTAPVLEEGPRTRFSVGLVGSGDTSVLPAITPGLGLLFTVGLPASFALEVQGQAWLPQATTTSPGATLTLFAGTLGARRDFTVGAFFVAPVLGLEAGAMRGRAFGFSNPELDYGLWLAGRGGLTLGFTRGWVRVGLRAEAVVPLVRPRFIAEGVGVLYTPPSISGRGGLSIEVLFPPRVEGGGGN